MKIANLPPVTTVYKVYVVEEDGVVSPLQREVVPAGTKVVDSGRGKNLTEKEEKEGWMSEGIHAFTNMKSAENYICGAEEWVFEIQVAEEDIIAMGTCDDIVCTKLILTDEFWDEWRNAKDCLRKANT